MTHVVCFEPSPQIIFFFFFGFGFFLAFGLDLELCTHVCHNHSLVVFTFFCNYPSMIG